MARIIICSLSNVTWTKEKYLDSFVEGFITALKRAGNEVISIRVNDFAIGGASLVYEEKTSAALRAFNPDLLITFNNVVPYPQLLDDLTCPIACFASDSLAFFANKDLLHKHAERYTFFNFSNDTIDAFPQWFPFIKKSQIIRFGQATDLRAEAIEQDINISFIGSIANWNRSLPDYFKSLPDLAPHPDPSGNWENSIKHKFFKALDDFEKDPLKSFPTTVPHFKPRHGNMETTAILLLTCKKRFEALSQLKDLGLTVFSAPTTFADVLLYNPELFRCFDYQTSVSMAHATRNYNRSKVSLNLPHAHAAEGFSWRVCDILASNAALLSCPQPDLLKLMNGYAKLPTYTSPAEARDLAQKLLKDKPWRDDLVAASQKMIDENCRFESKFKIMEEALPSLKLLPQSKKSSPQGSVIYLNEQEFLRKNRTRILQLVKTIRESHGRYRRDPNSLLSRTIKTVKKTLWRLFLLIT